MVNMGQALHDQLHDQLVPHLDWALTGTGTARYCTLLGQALHYYRLDLGQAMHAHSQDSLGRDPGQDAIRDMHCAIQTFRSAHRHGTRTA